MSTTLSNRYLVDLPEWRALSTPMINTNSAPFSTSGAVMAPDMRGRDYASPYVFFNFSNVLSSYNFKLDAWHYVASLGVGASYGQGSTAVFCPSLGPSGTISGVAATTRSVTLSTALPASVLQNSMANRGDGLGFIVRIIGNATAGSSGKIEERRIIANTSGTTPTIYFDKPLSFTPANGDRYEFLSGSILFLNAGTVVAGIFRRFDILTYAATASLATTNLPATIVQTHNQLIALDEQYVPHNRNPGEGYLIGAATYDTIGDFTKGCLTATAVPAANQITGQATAGDAGVFANQFRNYQIRIVEDLTTPTAVGQRRKITSHTAGASPVYTLASNWTVNPSATCKFVIENDTDKVIGFLGGTTTIYNYNITANTWDTTTWSNGRGAAFTSSGLTFHSFGITPDSVIGSNVKHSSIVSFRGSSVTCDILDIAGGTNGLWTNSINTIWSGSSGADQFVGLEYPYFAYNAHTQEGKYMYTALGTNSNYATQRMYIRFDAHSLSWSKVAGPKVLQGSTQLNGCCFAHCPVFQDGNTKIAFYNTPRIMGAGEYYQLMLTF